MLTKEQKELAKVINGYFGIDAAYLDIDVFTLAKRIIEAGWEKPVRCKDCRWMSRNKENNRAYCHGHIGVTIETAVNGYCYLGERREGE